MRILSKGKSVARLLAERLKETIAPTYRPELHYMRGRGPACERREQNRG